MTDVDLHAERSPTALRPRRLPPASSILLVVALTMVVINFPALRRYLRMRRM
jgi:hypothetical protein